MPAFRAENQIALKHLQPSDAASRGTKYAACGMRHAALLERFENALAAAFAVQFLITFQSFSRP